MSTRKQDKAIQYFQQIWQLSKANRKEQMQWLMRSLLVIRTQPRLSEAGFVLPTVAMVSLVVVLLTTAILIRSFDRSRNASNVRVNQAVLNAAAPALDRARAKIDALFADPTLPRGTPSDFALYSALNRKRYNLGDETRLKLVEEVSNPADGIQANILPIEKDDTLRSAWRFPVDTDNNGRFDSYTLYGIYFRSPSRNNTGQFTRTRKPLEARTPPMEGGVIGGQCAGATDTSASSVGASDWYKTGAKLTKSFFVYTATVPITNTANILDPQSQYEPYKGNRGFSALELQQDRSRIPLNNNAVWYDDDLEVSKGSAIRLNGRVATNSNLMVAGNPGPPVNKLIFYQVSDPDSCYYEQENSKIIVGGNIANGDVGLTNDDGQVEVHRFQGKATPPDGRDNTDEGISTTNKTTTQSGGQFVGYNNGAYSERIGLMVKAALSLHTGDPTDATVSAVSRYPQEVKERFQQRFENETKEPQQILTEELETYFEDHTRRVPYNEVSSSASSADAVDNLTEANVLGTTDPIRPPSNWMAIESPTDGSTTDYTHLPLKFGTGNTMFLPATEPTQQQNDGKENFIGDRILVGNNLPFFWPKFTTGGAFDKFADSQEAQPVKNGSNPVYWNATTIQRTRQSQLQLLPDLGSLEHDGFWETEAAKKPAVNENTGGLRVITGAGVYIDKVITPLGTGVRSIDSLAIATPSLAKSFLPEPALNTGVSNPPPFTTATVTSGNENIIVWPDLMPMWDGNLKGDLQMKATAVYHYKQGLASSTGSGEVDPNQVPIACVSSYYDPTDRTTARNQSGLPDVSGISDTDGNGTINDSDELADGSTPGSTTPPIPGVGSNNGRSNNGVTYNAPHTDDTGRTSAVSTYRGKLNRQARAIFPTGRIVNEPLRKALINLDANQPRSLGDNAAIDTAICALKILDGTLSVQSSPNVPHGAIKEAAFLDGRQVKSLNNFGSDNTKIAETQTALTNRYTLPLEQRQPLEIRVTELDLNLLRTKSIGTSSGSGSTNDQEYLLPNSGIIYATRDDALPDLSDNDSNPLTQALVSPTDFKLDSTRRPNGIRLINGSNLARTNVYRVAEKGLIMATNLPAYVKGGFNLHKDPNSGTVREEFETLLTESDWSNFYTRDNTLNLNFARRESQPGYGAGSGDQWRPATIISDAQTLLSNDFLDGFRNQGDYDLNNNQGNSAEGNRSSNGFWNNNFVTSAGYWDTGASTGFPTNTSKNSYLTNGVTPVQRRVNSHEYVMEICRKLPVSQCTPGDWVVGYDADANGTLIDTELNITATAIPLGTRAGALVSGTTARLAGDLTAPVGTGTITPADRPEDQRFARRVAFARNAPPDNKLLLTTIGSNRTAIPFGVDNNDKLARFPYSSGTFPRQVNNALWFRTTNNTAGNPGAAGDIRYVNNKPLYYKKVYAAASSVDQPDLVPILQIHSPAGTATGTAFTNAVVATNWLQVATTTTANAAFISGDTPSRSVPPERGGGLQNFVRFLENWIGQTARISGSFIQYKKSSYGAAPFYSVDPTTDASGTGSIFYSLNGSGEPDYFSGVTGFRYRSNITEYRASYYTPPTRAYGFDIALLSQSPDLFAQRFTVASTGRPSEYFREVGQDDPWIKTLLCAAAASDAEGGSGATYTTAAIPDRPSTCLISLPYPPNP